VMQNPILADLIERIQRHGKERDPLHRHSCLLAADSAEWNSAGRTDCKSVFRCNRGLWPVRPAGL
jgi:hypothetical protein